VIVGTGIDLTEVDRIAEKLSRSSAFKEKVFSPDEIKYCEKSANPAENYAARFAAKEAFLKATGLGLTLSHDLCDIIVSANPNGKPEIHLQGAFKKMLIENEWKNIHVSLSHIKSIACAVVIIER
jgi:holo-[acyl-carrier protein] synthase